MSKQAILLALLALSHYSVCKPNLELTQAHVAPSKVDVLLKVDVQVSNLTECGMYYNDDDSTYVVNTNFCTSGYGNKGTCNGDSGGPLSLDGVLIGLTSFGTELCEICSPSVYTRVVDYLDWIAENSDVEIK